uniref:Uncharacterized protein n=1 Tax=Ascaris lumbricoides TaxID=6252 RepID=A0A0M3INH3_ASCLU
MTLSIIKRLSYSKYHLVTDHMMPSNIVRIFFTKSKSVMIGEIDMIRCVIEYASLEDLLPSSINTITLGEYHPRYPYP